MSICWKCGKEFVNENNLGTILCDDCASKIPTATASSQIDNFDIKNDEISEKISEKEKFIEFCEIFGFKVSDIQMKVFELYNQSKQENKQMFINLGKQHGHNYLNTILINFELWKKDQRIAELEKYNAQLEYWKSKWYNSYDEIRNKYNKSKQTAVKEFIDFAIEKFSEVNDLGDFKYYLDNAEFKYVIKDLLKEKEINNGKIN
jgi:hypothetical protein